MCYVGGDFSSARYFPIQYWIATCVIVGERPTATTPDPRSSKLYKSALHCEALLDQGLVLGMVHDLIDCKKKQIYDTHNQKLSQQINNRTERN